MMRNNVMALLAGAPAAIAADLARDLLAIDLPSIEAMDGQLSAGPVERFSVSRGIAVVPVRGILTPNSVILERYLGWTTYFGLSEAMAELTERADVSAIVLDVDSPGGLVIGCSGAGNAIAAAAKVKPVHTLASPMAASAAYWMAAQASSVAVTPGGIVGSIGTAQMAYSTVGPDMYGDQWYILTSTHARAKRPDPGTEEGMTELRRSLDEAEAEFHAAVSAGRDIPLDDLPRRLSVTDDPRDGGAVFNGQNAISRGLADTEETRTAFYTRISLEYASTSQRAPGAKFRAQAAVAEALSQL